MTRNRIPRSRRLARCGAMAAVALTLFGAALPAASANPAARGAVAAQGGTPCGRVDVAPMVTIPVGKSTVIRPEVAVRRILLGNPENAQAARPSVETVPAPAGMRRYGIVEAACRLHHVGHHSLPVINEQSHLGVKSPPQPLPTRGRG